MQKLTILAAVFLVIAAAGCQGPADKELAVNETSILRSQLKESKREVKQLRRQLKVVAELRKETNLEDLYDLQAVKIGRYTNIYDKDKDGIKETLIVYLKPLDQAGDIIKAAGAVDVELWDLSRSQAEALLGKWRVTAQEMRELWFATVVTTNYRLTFDVSDRIDSFENPFTVTIVFTDYLTGKVFKEQRPINPE